MRIKLVNKTITAALVDVNQLDRASSHVLKCCGFDSLSGHIPKLQVQSLVWECMEGSQLMFLSHIDVSLSLKSNERMSSGEDKKNTQQQLDQCLA